MSRCLIDLLSSNVKIQEDFTLYCEGSVDHYANVGQLIKERREELGLSQAEVVRQLGRWEIQTSEAVFSRLENGIGGKTHWADHDFILALSNILQMSPREIGAALGHIDRLDIDVSVLRIVELLMQMSEPERQRAEKILQILVSQEKKEKSGSPT